MRSNFDILRELDDMARKFKDYVENFDFPDGSGRRRAHHTGSENGGSEATTGRKAESSYAVPVDISHDNENLYVEAELPGVSKEYIKLNMSGSGALEISGVKQVAAENETLRFFERERWSGAFRRLVALPSDIRIAADRVSASFKDGVLKVTLPKQEADRGVVIDIE